MNRREEYELLLKELDSPAEGLNGSLERAMMKQKRKNLIYRPFIGIAACFLLFIILVNSSATIAQACSKIPILKELAEAVTFSQSLSDAVENDYVQQVNLTKTDGDVTATIKYLIVDQKQVNVFYTLESDVYTQMYMRLDVYSSDGSEAPPHSSYVPYGLETNGELRSFSIDFVDSDVPDSLMVKLQIIDYEQEEKKRQEQEDSLFSDPVERHENYIAEMDFLLEFDPTFTETGKQITVNKTVILDNQEITISDVEIFPTHIRINVMGHPENTSWLKELEFYILADDDKIFQPVSSGVSATGDDDSPAMVSFRADSSYFYEAEKLELIIGGAVWMDKQKERAYINLETGETENLPEEVELYHVEETSDGITIQLRAPFREKDHFHQVLYMEYYDAEGNKYESGRRGTHNDLGEYGNKENIEDYFIEIMPLPGYHEKEVWVCPVYSHVWKAETPVVVEIQ